VGNDSLGHVRGTGGLEAARAGEKRRDEQFVRAEQQQNDAAGDARPLRVFICVAGG
jgi:hypothetical protein